MIFGSKSPKVILNDIIYLQKNKMTETVNILFTIKILSLHRFKSYGIMKANIKKLYNNFEYVLLHLSRFFIVFTI